MTPDEYREKFGPEYQRAEGQGWFVALIQVLHDQHPLRKLSGRMDGDKLAGSPVLLNEIGGYEKCLEVIKTISTQPEKQADDIPSEYPEE